MDILIVNGKKAYRKFILSHRHKHGLKGVLKRTTKHGNWEKDYWFKRTKEGGKNKEVMFSESKPIGWEDDILSEFYQKGEIAFQGEHLICTYNAYQTLQFLNEFTALAVFVIKERV